MELNLRELDLIIFDCDGVLVDSEVLSCRCLCQVLATYGFRLELTEAPELFPGRNTAAVVQHYSAEGRVPPDNFQSDLKASVRHAFQASLLPFPGIGPVLAILYDAGADRVFDRMAEFWKDGQQV